MATSGEHIVHSYDEDLRSLTNLILQMGGLVESQIAAAIEAVRTRDSELSARIIEDDDKIDALELDVETRVTRLLALRQPMAVDLRFIIGSLRMSADLERMGDLAANIAKRTIALSQTREITSLWVIPSMGQRVQGMVKEVLDAFVEQSLDKAHEVWISDQTVDQMYTSLFRQLLTYMMEDARNITPCTHLLFVAKNLERIADHATNMAEVICFGITGQRQVLGERPKADESSTFAGREPSGEDGNAGK